MTVPHQVVPPLPPPSQLEGSLPLSSQRGFGGEKEKCAASASFLLADNLCMSSEQMAGNLAITMYKNDSRLHTEAKDSLPQSHLLFCLFSLFRFPYPPGAPC